MKTSIFLLTLLTATAAQAGVAYNPKHPAPAATTNYRYTYAEVQDPAFAHFEWLAADTEPSATISNIVISIADQRLYVYHDQQLIGWSSVSSGKPGHETPTGDFTVSEKDLNHHSNLYEDAPMPYFMRLTDGGVGMHAGFLPGYAASHGCVRLPPGMARELYQHVESGTRVQITEDQVSAQEPVAQVSADTSPLVQN